MAKSGAWIPNLINWFIGIIAMEIWMLLSFIFGFFGMWQVGLDGAMGVYKDFKPADVSSGYMSTMSVGGN